MGQDRDVVPEDD